MAETSLTSLITVTLHACRMRRYEIETELASSSFPVSIPQLYMFLVWQWLYTNVMANEKHKLEAILCMSRHCLSGSIRFISSLIQQSGSVWFTRLLLHVALYPGLPSPRLQKKAVREGLGTRLCYMYYRCTVSLQYIQVVVMHGVVIKGHSYSS